MKGKPIVLFGDMTMQRVKQATINASDLAYKGLRNKNNLWKEKPHLVNNKQNTSILCFNTIMLIKFFFIN